MRLVDAGRIDLERLIKELLEDFVLSDKGAEEKIRWNIFWPILAWRGITSRILVMVRMPWRNWLGTCLLFLRSTLQEESFLTAIQVSMWREDLRRSNHRTGFWASRSGEHSFLPRRYNNRTFYVRAADRRRSYIYCTSLGRWKNNTSSWRHRH